MSKNLDKGNKQNLRILHQMASDMIQVEINNGTIE